MKNSYGKHSPIAEFESRTLRLAVQLSSTELYKPVLFSPCYAYRIIICLLRCCKSIRAHTTKRILLILMVLSRNGRSKICTSWISYKFQLFPSNFVCAMGLECLLDDRTQFSHTKICVSLQSQYYIPIARALQTNLHVTYIRTKIRIKSFHSVISLRTN